MLASCGYGMEYGTDISFPMHYAKITNNFDWLPHNKDPSLPTPEEYQDIPIQPLGDRQAFYDNYIKGCIDHYGEDSPCMEYETDRIAMNLRQPQSMQNYTEMGFVKIKTPGHVWKLIHDFWEANKHNQSPEKWGEGNSYVNHWEVPTTFVSIEDENHEGGGMDFRQEIWDAAKATVEEWTQQKLGESSLYGVRIYHRGSVLATHVDRLPLVSSAIINVDADLEEPWPLEVIGHDGKAHNVTMEPGDMVLYESHSVLHGRPFPLKGEFVANIFVHFQPTKDNDSQQPDEEVRHDGAKDFAEGEFDEYDLPPYVIKGSAEAKYIMERRLNGLDTVEEEAGEDDGWGTGSTTPHVMAQNGELEMLQEMREEDENSLHVPDHNGWLPIHEAARGGHLEVVKYLHECGADLDAVTNGGGSVLYYATHYFGEDHPVAEYLVEHGAEYHTPSAEEFEEEYHEEEEGWEEPEEEEYEGEYEPEEEGESEL